VACIHDEIILEAEVEQAETAKQILEEVMVVAGEHYLTEVPVVIEATIVDSSAGEWGEIMPKKSASFRIY